MSASAMQGGHNNEQALKTVDCL